MMIIGYRILFLIVKLKFILATEKKQQLTMAIINTGLGA
jgi:hypothetical protein